MPAHKLISAHRCICGWEGDSAITHIMDVTTPSASDYAALVEATQGSIQGQIIHSLIKLLEDIYYGEGGVEGGLDGEKLAPGITLKDARKTYQPR